MSSLSCGLVDLVGRLNLFGAVAGVVAVVSVLLVGLCGAGVCGGEGIWREHGCQMC